MRVQRAVAALLLTAGLCARASAQWTSTTPLPKGYNGHALVSWGGYLYNFGGGSEGNGILDSQNVYYAPVTGGAVGAWKTTALLPEGVFYHAGAAANGYVYALGGQHYQPATGNIIISNAVYYAKANADGTLGPWQTANPLPEAVYYLSAAVWNGRIYATGGWNGSNLTAGVYSAVVNADGSLGPWVTQKPLPQPLYTHVTVSNGMLYVVAGAVNGGTQIVNSVYFTKINADGTLAGWTPTAPLPTPLSNHAGVYGNGRVFVMGGWTGSQITNATWEATSSTAGALSPWTPGPQLPDSIYLHAAAIAGQYIFVSGGADNTLTVPSVFSMPLPPPPAPTDVLPPRTAIAFGAPIYGAAPPILTPATPISLSAVDDAATVGDGAGVGVQSTSYAIDAGTFTPYSSAFSILPDGAHWVQYFSVDKLGRSETVHLASAAVDGTPPVSTLSIGAPRATLAAGAVYVGPNTQLAAAAADPVVNGAASGVSSLSISIDSAAFAAYAGAFTLPAVDGPHTIALKSTDNVGNVEAAHSATVYRDAAPPVTTASPDGSRILGAAGAAVTFSATDAGSGVNHTEFQVDGGAWTAAAATQPLPEGAHAISYRSVDNVGNVETAKSAVYKVDLTAPQTTLTASAPSQAALGMTFMTADASISLSAQDPVSSGVASGVARTLYSLDGGADQAYAAPFKLAAGAHTVSFGSVDNAGNAEPRQLARFYVSPYLADLLEGQSGVALGNLAAVTGAVRSNGAVALNQGSSITGSATAMTVSLNNGSAVNGTITQGVATLPAALDLTAARAWADANDPNPYQGTTLTLAAGQTLALSSGVYSLTGLSLGANASLTFGAPAQVFVHGAVSLGNGAGLNAGGDPTQLFVVADGAVVSIGSGARLAANVFAPAAAVSLTGNGDFSGRLLGQSISIVGVSDVLPPRTTAAVGQPRFGANPTFVTPATAITLSAVDDAATVGDGAGVGVQSTSISIDSAAFAPYAGPLKLSGDGAHWLTYFSVDKVGNAEAGKQLSLAVDSTPPASSLGIGSPKATLASGAVVVGPATQVSASASDLVSGGVASGVAQLLVGVDGAALSAYSGAFALPAVDGAHTIALQSIDNVGNAEAAHSQAVWRDGTPPVTTVSPDGARILGAGAALSLSALDPVSGGIASGVNHTEYQLDGGAWAAATASLPLPEGVHNVSYRSVDNVGNVELARSAVYRVDLTAPQTTLTLSGGVTLFGADAVTPDTAFALSAQDPVSNGVASGVAKIVYSVDGGADLVYAAPFKLAAGAHTLSYGSVDNAGNAETRATARVVVTTLLSDGLGAYDALILSDHADAGETLRTNGTFAARNHSSVEGDVWALKVKVAKDSVVTGAVHAGQQTLPAPAYDLAAAASWAAAHGAAAPPQYLSGGALSLSGDQQLTLSAGDYYLTGLSVRGDAALAVSGRVNVFVHGRVVVTGRGSLNAAGDASALWLVSDSNVSPEAKDSDGDDNDDDQSRGRDKADGNNDDDDGAQGVVLRGNSRSAFNLYAPAAAMLVQGRGQFAGRVVVRRLALTGKSSAPSTTTLPAPTHAPGDKKTFARGEGSGSTATSGKSGGKDDAVVLDDLSSSTPASTVAKASESSLGAAPAAPAGASASSSGHWQATAPRAASAASVTSPARRLDPPQASGTTAAPGVAARLDSAPPDRDGFVPEGTFLFASPPTGASPGPRSDEPGPLIVKSALPPLALSPRHALALVSSDGSAVHAKDGRGVVIPPGATGSGLAVTVAPPPVPAPIDQRRQQDSQASLGLVAVGTTSAVQYGPEGTKFAKPVTLEIPYDLAQLPQGAAESALAIHYWNPSTSQWERLDSSVDTVNHVVRAQTSHFSLYQVFSGGGTQGGGGGPAPGAALAFGQVYAYPNPARPGQTPTIHVEAGSADHVEIHIYDLAGALKDSSSSDGAQGTFEYRWDVSSVGSGVYIYVVTATQSGGGKIRKTGRVAVIK